MKKKKEEKLSEEEKTARLASKAFYKTRKTPKSQMIMLKILQANRLDTLTRIQKICSLTYYIQHDSKDLNIDYDTVEILYDVANALKSTTETKTAHWYDNYNYSVLKEYPIPWGFMITEKNYLRYIHNWMKTYTFFKIEVPEVDKIETTIRQLITYCICPYCEEVLLEIPEEITKKQLLELTKETYKESFETVKKILIDEEQIKKRKTEISNIYNSYNKTFTYKPPYWEASYIKCQKCQQKIRIAFNFFKGSNYKKYDPLSSPEFGTKELIVKQKLEVTENTLGLALKFKLISSHLTKKGYNQLVNSFTAYAEPPISKIEWEILKLVDEDDLKKYLEQEFSADKKPDKGEEQQ